MSRHKEHVWDSSGLWGMWRGLLQRESFSSLMLIASWGGIQDDVGSWEKRIVRIIGPFYDNTGPLWIAFNKLLFSLVFYKLA